jgi:hypothetical protein
MDTRALIFSNLVNGVPVHQVCRDFHKTESEVMQVFAFILRKIKSYIFLRQTSVAYPTITASNLEEAKRLRLTCLTVLPKLKLDKEPQFKDIQTELVTPDNVMTVSRNLNT